MRIRTQFIITMALFGITLLIMATSLIVTNRQVDRLNEQDEIAHNIERAASELSYLSNDYLLYRESQQRARWESKFSSLSEDLSKLNPPSPEQQVLVNQIKANQGRLKAVFSNVVSTLESPSQNQDAVAELAFIQIAWSRMEIQNQGMIFDALLLSQKLGDQVDRLKQANMVLFSVLAGLFGVYFLANYFVIFRRTLRSLSHLQAGTKIIGSGNLEYAIADERADEIGELSRAFNQMAASLKDVTASKADLEREIAERKRAEEAILRAKNEWERTFDSVPDLVAILDAQYRIVRVNRAMAQRLGATPEQCVGLTCFTCVHGSCQPPKSCPHTRTLRDGQEHTAEVHEDRLGGDFLVSTTPLFDEQGQMMGSVHVARDITERKRAEASLAEKAEELARSNQELEQFAYVASHDLQEPLRMVASYVQLLAERYQGQLDERADRYIAYAVDGATRMKTLINDLLAYSRVGTQGKPLVPIDSQAVLEDVLGRLQVAIEEKQATVTHDPLPTVLADEVQLGQVFQNLIGNALKFSNEAPPRIHVGAQPDAERGDVREWRFSVADNGIGLEPKYAERIFVIFQRLHGPTEYSGTGIGLAICKKIVERHGGRMWVESQPGQGATFYFTMPGV